MYKKFHSNNGLTVVVSPMREMSSVSLGIWIGAGGRYEELRKSGISHLVEHMLFKGTITRSAKELKQSIEGIGGEFNGFTSDEVTCYMIKVPAQYIELGMDVLTDMVLNPKFDKNDLEKEKFVVCEEIKMYRDQPADHVLDLLGSIMWPNNALGRALTGTIATVKRFSIKDLVTYKENNYHPANIAIVAAGKVEPEKVFAYSIDKFHGKEKKKKFSIKTPTLNQKAPRMKLAQKDTKQTHIAMGFPVLDKNISERFAIKMMNIMFGGNMSSRLFEELREKYGLCYDISSSYKRYSDLGEIQIHAGVDSTKLLKAVIAILDELKKLRDLGVTEDELKRTKEYAKGQFLLAMEATSTRMIWFGDRLMVHKHIPRIEDILTRIDNVRIDDVRKISAKIFKASLVNLAIVGKVKPSEENQIRKELAKL